MNSLLTRSGARRLFASACVVKRFFARLAPLIPWRFMRRATWSRPTSRPARSRNLDRRSERGNQMKTGEIERGNAPRFIPQNIPHKDPTLHDRTDKERHKTQ